MDRNQPEFQTHHQDAVGRFAPRTPRSGPPGRLADGGSGPWKPVLGWHVVAKSSVSANIGLALTLAGILCRLGAIRARQELEWNGYGQAGSQTGPIRSLTQESFMIEKFGSQYTTCKREVKSLIPLVRSCRCSGGQAQKCYRSHAQMMSRAYPATYEHIQRPVWTRFDGLGRCGKARGMHP